VIGNLTADPELRFTPSGAAVANFTVASTPRTYDRNSGEWKDGEALFLRCNLWRQPAENVDPGERIGAGGDRHAEGTAGELVDGAALAALPSCHAGELSSVRATIRATRPRTRNGLTTFPLVNRWCPRQDSNLRHRLRRAVLYPLSYGGGTENEPNASPVIVRRQGRARKWSY